MGQTKNLRDRLRATTLGSEKRFHTQKVEWDGETFIIRQPSVAERARIIEAAKLKTGDVEKSDPLRMQIYTVICCTYTPDGERVFDEEDFEALAAEPPDSYVDRFYRVALELMNIRPEEAGKDFEPTTSGSSSSA